MCSMHDELSALMIVRKVQEEQNQGKHMTPKTGKHDACTVIDRKHGLYVD